MYAMNMPKFLWSEAVMTAVYLINRTPSRLLGWKTPYKMLRGVNEFIVPPKVFECTCFVRDHRPSVGKLDPERLSVYLWVIPQVKKATSVGILLNGVSLLVWM